MGQRVGANAKQHNKIKRLLADNVPQQQIAEMFNIEPQSLEKICAHIEGREEVQLVLQDNPEMNLLMAENKRLKAQLGIEETDDATGEGIRERDEFEVPEGSGEEAAHSATG